MDTRPSPLYVGATFDRLDELREAYKDYAIKKTFEYKVRKANKSCYTIECKAEACPCRLHGSSVYGSGLYRIKTYNDEHTCFGLDYIGHAQADKDFIVNCIAERPELAVDLPNPGF